MLKTIMTGLMICSAISLADTATVNYLKKDINDSTSILKLSIPDDTLLYTCLQPDTYSKVIKTGNDLKFKSEELDLCYNSIDSYKIKDSVNVINLGLCQENLDELKDFNNEITDQLKQMSISLQQEREERLYWIVGAFATGALVTGLNVYLIK